MNTPWSSTLPPDILPNDAGIHTRKILPVGPPPQPPPAALRPETSHDTQLPNWGGKPTPVETLGVGDLQSGEVPTKGTLINLQGEEGLDRTLREGEGEGGALGPNRKGKRGGPGGV